MGSAIEHDHRSVVPEASDAELQEAIDYAANFYLGISADEFMRRWEAHEISEDDPQVQNVLYVIRFLASRDGAGKP